MAMTMHCDIASTEARIFSGRVESLVCTGTLEERIGQLIDEKRALASAVVGTTGEAWLSELSTDQLRDLVALDRSAVE